MEHTQTRSAFTVGQHHEDIKQQKHCNVEHTQTRSAFTVGQHHEDIKQQKHCNVEHTQTRSAFTAGLRSLVVNLGRFWPGTVTETCRRVFRSTETEPTLPFLSCSRKHAPPVLGNREGNRQICCHRLYRITFILFIYLYIYFIFIFLLQVRKLSVHK